MSMGSVADAAQQVIESPEHVRALAIEARLQEAAGVIAAATASMVELIGEAAADDLWGGIGFRSIEQWVTLRCGVSVTHAHRLVRAAEVLRELPQVRAAFGEGAISEDHVAAIARAGVTAFHDDEVAGLARQASVPQLRKGLSFLPPIPATDDATTTDADTTAESESATDDAEDEANSAAEPQPHPQPEPDPAPDDRVSFGYGEHGRWWLHADLSAETGALVERALSAARDREFRDRRGSDADDARDEAAPLVGVSWADALSRLAGDTLDVLDPATAAGRPPSDRYQVHIHLNANGSTNLHLGPGLPDPIRDLLTCDCTVRSWLHHADGSINMSRKTRVVNLALRLAVEHRDGGCTVPGCAARKNLHIHHIVHWAHGGVTDTWNLVCLCPWHHRAVHRGELALSGNPDTATLHIVDSHGRPMVVSPPKPPASDPLLLAATLDSPARPGERADWRWFVWRDPAKHPPIRRHPDPPPKRHDGISWHLLRPPPDDD